MFRGDRQLPTRCGLGAQANERKRTRSSLLELWTLKTHILLILACIFFFFFTVIKFFMTVDQEKSS